MIRHNYHTHTYRCGHAVGEDEEYVLEAIGLGMQSIGFSDHVMLKGIIQEGVRGDFELTEDYFAAINNIKEKFKERINVLLGFEAEPFPDYFDYYKNLLITNKIDYLILGNHCYFEDGTIKPFFSSNTSKEDIIHYKDTLIKGMETGLFLYVCHPDYFMGGYNDFDETCKICSEEICKKASELGIPLEFNFAAIRRGKYKINDKDRFLYPHNDFWQIAKKYNCKMVLGLDAHSPYEISSDKNDIGYRMAKELNMEVIHELDIIKYKNNIRIKYS